MIAGGFSANLGGFEEGALGLWLMLGRRFRAIHPCFCKS